MGGDTWENPAIVDVAGEDADGIIISTFFDENDAASTAEAKKFVSGFKKEQKDSTSIIPAVTALGYDAYIVLLDAIKRADSTDGDAIRKALAETKDFEGVTGTINFDKNGDAIKNLAVIKTVKNGKFVYLDTVTVEK